MKTFVIRIKLVVWVGYLFVLLLLLLLTWHKLKLFVKRNLR